jgi:hypothetical protein
MAEKIEEILIESESKLGFRCNGKQLLKFFWDNKEKWGIPV